jgi:uncharacterized protein (DUF1684 family)
VKRIVVAFLLLSVVTCRREKAPEPFDRAAHEKDVMAWRQRRATRLQAEDGWLSLVALDRLHEGKNEVKLPDGPAGTIDLQNGKTVLEPRKDSGLTIDGKPVTGPVELLNDADPKGPTIVKRGSAQFQIHKTYDQYAVRIKDAQSEARRNFKGLEYYPIDPKWRVVARFEPYNPKKKLAVPNVIGITGEEVSPGALVFTVNGKEHRLDAIDEQGAEDLFLIIKDQTSRDMTYPAGRYLYAKHPGPDGTTIVDFNKAYNPPCTFTPFATCPLPPPQNVLPFRIEAGEKRYAGAHH